MASIDRPTDGEVLSANPDNLSFLVCVTTDDDSPLYVQIDELDLSFISDYTFSASPRPGTTCSQSQSLDIGPMFDVLGFFSWAGVTNKYFSYSFNDGVPHGFYFGAYSCEQSGGFGGFIRPSRITAQHEFWRPDRPIPASLLLQLDGSDSKNPALSVPTMVYFAKDSALGCCWLSKPIQIGPTLMGNPAFWVLQKTAADTMVLTLKRITGDLASFTLKGKAARDCSFPLQLKLVDKPNAEVGEIRSTITISQTQ